MGILGSGGVHDARMYSEPCLAIRIMNVVNGTREVKSDLEIYLKKITVVSPAGPRTSALHAHVHAAALRSCTGHPQPLVVMTCRHMAFH